MVDPGDLVNRPEDPFVRNRTVAGGPRRDVVTLAGLLGDSDRAGCRRLYLTTQLDYFVEFRTDDVVAVDDVAPGDVPFPGLDATRVTLNGGATLDWVRRAVPSSDAFALEVSDAIVLPPFVETWEAQCIGVTVHFGQSDFDPCQGGRGNPGGGTFGQWPTQGGRTCATCNQATCATCDQGTCVSCIGGTCQTCQGPRCATMPGTCQTCQRLTCDPGCVETATCASCLGTCDDTCSTCWDTCLGTCVSCRGTCDATCASTCSDTCVNTCAQTCWVTCDTCNTCQFSTCGCPVSDPAWCIVRA
ncbi:hypothetical protein [Micropruina sp.]|uniref:hypothetical protein n=1 Tax=Micropruina sp. TaxID=2737536 RepID=UPI0026381C37|nr:hypothetical protein [Micropruina sp.]